MKWRQLYITMCVYVIDVHMYVPLSHTRILSMDCARDNELSELRFGIDTTVPVNWSLTIHEIKHSGCAYHGQVVVLQTGEVCSSRNYVSGICTCQLLFVISESRCTFWRYIFISNIVHIYNKQCFASVLDVQCGMVHMTRVKWECICSLTDVTLKQCYTCMYVREGGMCFTAPSYTYYIQNTTFILHYTRE
jgi:hypothetical protein